MIQTQPGDGDPFEPLANAIDGMEMSNLVGAGVLVGAVLVAVFIKSVVWTLATKAARRGKQQMLTRILHRSRVVATIAVAILAVELTLPLITMPEAVGIFVDRMVNLFLIGVCGWLVILVLRALTDARMSRYDINAEDNLEARRIATRMRVLRQMMTMVILLVTVATMLMTFPSVRAIGVSLFASAGVAGIVIGFAARPVLSNLLAGIQIALTQPIRIGDAVIMEGEWGWIEEITSTYVVVKIWDWRRLVVPLTQIIEKPFQNWTRETASIIGSVVWHLDYTAPVGRMREKLKEFLDESELWDGDVQVLQVIETSEETMELRALMSAKNSPTAWDLRCEIREKMISWLQAECPGALPRRRGQLQIDQSDIAITEEERPSADSGKDRNISDQIQHPEDGEGTDEKKAAGHEDSRQQ
ncbi:mechanosensitive ion channel family protein [Aquisalinus luteolus]|uniref:Mechanosensitive ion channel protein MscS n=2 Tax=Aquisalinus luteolus TaxID=1566827 RepID=A0A8J3A0I3_9PROT|nr:mechanosensitive ion channel domain-containing protein [Aquisalinus luteolus]GGH93379.1 mechanosensitive ion channel protein MscS [Aquisalinus luteolus]